MEEVEYLVQALVAIGFKMIKFPPVLFGVSQNVTIVNQALNSDGSPVTGAVVTLFREGIFVTTCITDAAGVYRFDNLVEANYNVKVTYPNGTLLWVDYTSSRGTLISPLSTSITTSASFTITTSGSSTTVSISSAGSR